MSGDNPVYIQWKQFTWSQDHDDFYKLQNSVQRGNEDL